MIKYRANAEIFELQDYALKKILDAMIEGETDFETVKKMILKKAYHLPNKMLEPDKFADAYAAELQEIYNINKNGAGGYAEWYEIYTVNRDIGYQIATAINGYLIWLQRRKEF